MTQTIDDLGRIVSARVGDLEAAELGYDTKGRLSTFTQGDGSAGAPDEARPFTFGYKPDTGTHEAGLLASITDPLSRAVSFDYDAAGRVTTQTLPDGRQIGFGYDAALSRVLIAPMTRISGPLMIAYASGASGRIHELAKVPSHQRGNSVCAFGPVARSGRYVLRCRPQVRPGEINGPSGSWRGRA